MASVAFHDAFSCAGSFDFDLHIAYFGNITNGFNFSVLENCTNRLAWIYYLRSHFSVHIWNVYDVKALSVKSSLTSSVLLTTGPHLMTIPKIFLLQIWMWNALVLLREAFLRFFCNDPRCLGRPVCHFYVFGVFTFWSLSRLLCFWLLMEVFFHLCCRLFGTDFGVF